MRVAFAGTPPFAAQALEAILASGHEVPLVLTRPDRPAGRGLQLAASPVAQLAERHGIPLAKPHTLRDPAERNAIVAASPDVMVVAAYGLILPREALDIPRLGCLNVHASLLPRWRGAAPIQRALLAGDARTGITIMRMEEGLDTGPALLEEAIAIGPRETAGTLTQRLAELGARSIVAALDDLSGLAPTPQDDALATYAAKVEKAEAAIDWRRTSEEIDRHVRAFDPAPGATATLDGVSLKVWSVEPADGRGEPGTVLQAAQGRLVVATGNGALALIEVQKPGGKRLSASQFLQGARLEAGRKLDSAGSPA